VPWRAAALAATGLVAWLAASAYSVQWNPEVRFFLELTRVQDEWARKMDAEHGAKVVVFGGSSTTFSVVGEQLLEEFGVPGVNRGLAVGMGVKVTTLNAIKDLRRGDTLIMAIEPEQMAAAPATTSLAAQFSVASGHGEWVTGSWLSVPGMPIVSALLALRPGGYHTVTLAGKIAQRRALYRYSAADARASGWVRTDVRLPMTITAGPTGVSEEFRAYLRALAAWTRDRGIRLAYSLPTAYVPASQEREFQARNLELLLEIGDMLPVLREPGLGTDSNPAHFADTGWHLNAEGSRLRTAALGRALRAWDVWSLDDLRHEYTVRTTPVRPAEIRLTGGVPAPVMRQEIASSYAGVAAGAAEGSVR
jgi:hypothetical protein